MKAQVVTYVPHFQHSPPPRKTDTTATAMIPRSILFPKRATRCRVFAVAAFRFRSATTVLTPGMDTMDCLGRGAGRPLASARHKLRAPATAQQIVQFHADDLGASHFELGSYPESKGAHHVPPSGVTRRPPHHTTTAEQRSERLQDVGTATGQARAEEAGLCGERWCWHRVSG